NGWHCEQHREQPRKHAASLNRERTMRWLLQRDRSAVVKSLDACRVRTAASERGRVAIERVYYCDWRECETNARTARQRPPMTFITVTEETGRPLHFCSWDCILKHAAEKPPVEVVSLSD